MNSFFLDRSLEVPQIMHLEDFTISPGMAAPVMRCPIHNRRTTLWVTLC